MRQYVLVRIRALLVVVSLLILMFINDSLSFAQSNITVDPVGTKASEVTIAIDPANPHHLIAGANLHYAYHSTNGGSTWIMDTLFSKYGVWGDPSLLFDEQGGAYYAHLSNSLTGHWIDRIVVARSSDGGASWPADTGIGLNGEANQDKEWLACDFSNSPRRGTMYMSWTEFDKYASQSPHDSSRILFSRSIDHGITWSTPAAISDIGGNCIDSDSTDEGAIPAVDTNGNICVVWADKRGLLLRRSTDGGVNFGTVNVLSGTVEGWDFPMTGLQRCNGLPVMLTDFSPGPHRGNMYIMWSDRKSQSSRGIVVLLMRSTDGGMTWSAPAQVNTDTTGRDHFFPAMAIDQTTGHINIAYYDRRGTTDTETEVWLSHSTDGGATFHDTRVSATSFIPTSNDFLGDYIGVAAANGRVYPIWTRMDGTVKSILTAVLVDSEGTMAVERTNELPLLPSLAQNYPNPFGGNGASTTIIFTLTAAQVGDGTPVTLVVYDISGREITRLLDAKLTAGEHKINLAFDALPPGKYVYRLRAGGRVEERMMTVMK